MKNKFLPLFAIFCIFTACADYNSSTSDDLEYIENVANDGDRNFSQAFSIIKNRCASCHDHHQEWNSFNSNQLWIDQSGVITKSNATTSQLITKLSRNGGSGTMPPSGELTNDEYIFLKKWINEMP
jgi:uncharacterized membrane protein